MPISHIYKIIFIHIPKTGGTSVEYLLGMHGNINDIGVKIYTNQRKDYINLFGNGLQHLTASEVKRYCKMFHFKNYESLKACKIFIDKCLSFLIEFPLGLSFSGSKSVFQNYMKFSVVRNPYDRLVSYIAWLNGNGINDIFLTKDRFNKFIEKLISKEKIILKPQYHFIINNTILSVDHVIKFETLEDDLKFFLKDYVIEFKFPQRMKSDHLNYREYYTKNSIEYVLRYYKKDFEYFSYDTTL